MHVARSAAIHRPTELNVTLSFKVLALQLTTFFEVETATLRPSNRIAIVKMSDREELKGAPLASGFRLDTIFLAANGMVDTMRLIPTHQPPQPPFPEVLSRSRQVTSFARTGIRPSWSPRPRKRRCVSG